MTARIVLTPNEELDIWLKCMEYMSRLYSTRNAKDSSDIRYGAQRLFAATVGKEYIPIMSEYK